MNTYYIYVVFYSFVLILVKYDDKGTWVAIKAIRFSFPLVFGLRQMQSLNF